MTTLKPLSSLLLDEEIAWLKLKEKFLKKFWR